MRFFAMAAIKISSAWWVKLFMNCALHTPSMFAWKFNFIETARSTGPVISIRRHFLRICDRSIEEASLWLFDYLCVAYFTPIFWFFSHSSASNFFSLIILWNMLIYWSTLIPRQGRKETVSETSTSSPVLSLVWITLGILYLVWWHWNRRKRVFKSCSLYYSLLLDLLCVRYCLCLKICSRKAICCSKFIKRAASLTLLLRLDEIFIWDEWIIFVSSHHLLTQLFIGFSSLRLKLLLAIDDVCRLANSCSRTLL